MTTKQHECLHYFADNMYRQTRMGNGNLLVERVITCEDCDHVWRESYELTETEAPRDVYADLETHTREDATPDHNPQA